MFAMFHRRPFSRRLPLAALVLSLAALPAFAQTPAPETLTGVPVVQDSGTMTLGGRKVVLWGIDTLAPDQQCWQGETPWPCGEEASSSLRHFVDGRMVECAVQSTAADGSVTAKCCRQKGHKRKDISEHLVRHGWALDRGTASGGAYFEAEEEAQKDKRGVWGSRFQTAQDWRDGVQRFVGEPQPTSEEPPPTDESDQDENEE